MKRLMSNAKDERANNRGAHNTSCAPKHWKGNFSFGILGVFFVIILLTLSDFFVLHLTFLSESFQSITVPLSSFFSFVFALCLEVTPCVLAIEMNSLSFNRCFNGSDKERPSKDFFKTLLIIFLCLLVLTSLLGFVTSLRQQIIDERGGREAYKEGTYATRVIVDSAGNSVITDGDESYLIDRFLKYEPTYTSVLAFLFSFVFFKLNYSRRTAIQEEKQTPDESAILNLESAGTKADVPREDNFCATKEDSCHSPND